MVTDMKTTEAVSVTPIPNTLERGEGFFDNCESCGRSMMTIDYQIHLITACPEWDVDTLEDVRNLLVSSGVHYLYEVNPGYCGYCATR